MDDTQRLKLHELIQQNDVQDNTDRIKHLKHSELIREDVKKIQLLISSIGLGDFKLLDQACLPHCNFLFTNYTDIYNKLLKGRIDHSMLYKLLDCLKLIEDGKKTQHEASYEIGMILKKMYIDPKIYNEPQVRESRPISWQEYKNKKI
jgi:hypothetical protein